MHIYLKKYKNQISLGYTFNGRKKKKVPENSASVFKKSL